MTTSFLPSVHDRLVRLTQTLGVLKERVREAVATEMGRVVADAVRDVLTAALRHRPVETGEPDRPRDYRRAESDPWADDEPDPWEPKRSAYPERDERTYRSQPEETITPAPRTGWAKAVSVGMSVVKWLHARRLPLWPCVGFGALVGAVSVSSGRLVRAIVAAVVTAVDLIGLTQPTVFPLLD